MKKLVLCNIPFKEKVDLITCESNDLSLPVAKFPVIFPINSFMQESLQEDDEVKAVLLIKDDEKPFWRKHADEFKEEIKKVCDNNNAKVEFVEIVSPFSEESTVHEDLLMRVINEISIGAHIICDITFGSKDLPIIVFTALGFAEKFLQCEVDNILYGQGFFKEGNVEKSILCDMSPLYYLSSVTNTAQCNSPEEAKQLLKRMLSL